MLLARAQSSSCLSASRHPQPSSLSSVSFCRGSSYLQGSLAQTPAAPVHSFANTQTALSQHGRSLSITASLSLLKAIGFFLLLSWWLPLSPLPSNCFHLHWSYPAAASPATPQYPSFRVLGTTPHHWPLGPDHPCSLESMVGRSCSFLKLPTSLDLVLAPS